MHSTHALKADFGTGCSGLSGSAKSHWTMTRPSGSRREEMREGLRPEVLCLERVRKTIVSMNLAAPEVNAALRLRLVGLALASMCALPEPACSRSRVSFRRYRSLHRPDPRPSPPEPAPPELPAARRRPPPAPSSSRGLSPKRTCLMS